MICVSRPTNPTGNVITDEELMKLDLLAQQRNIPLVIETPMAYPSPASSSERSYHCGTRISFCA